MIAFDEATFPELTEPGLTGGPGFSVNIIKRRNGSNFRVTNRSVALHTYNVSPLIRTDTMLQTVQAFYVARNGSNRGFRFKDWHDYALTTTNVGDPAVLGGFGGFVYLINGEYRLFKEYTNGGSTYKRRITKPRASGFVLLAGGGVVSSGYTLNAVRGTVTFTGGVPGGTLTWYGTFDVPVRFSPDSDDITAITIDNFQQGKVTLSLEEVPIFDDLPTWQADTPITPLLPGPGRGRTDTATNGGGTPSGGSGGSGGGGGGTPPAPSGGDDTDYGFCCFWCGQTDPTTGDHMPCFPNYGWETRPSGLGFGYHGWSGTREQCESEAEATFIPYEDGLDGEWTAYYCTSGSSVGAGFP